MIKRTHLKAAKIFSVLAALQLSLSGCLLNMPKPDDPKYTPPPPVRKAPPPKDNGSLYKFHRSMALFEDDRARRVGDILTVKLQELTKSNKKSKTSIKKDSTTDISDATIAGRTTGLGPHNFGFDLEGKRSFDGKGDVDLQGSLNGTITVSVIDVLPNGNLMISGEKWLTLSEGDEFIRLTGLVRPSDIEADNTVPSNRIANARIAYSGTGQTQEANKMGWIARFFVSSFWPF